MAVCNSAAHVLSDWGVYALSAMINHTRAQVTLANPQPWQLELADSLCDLGKVGLALKVYDMMLGVN